MDTTSPSDRTSEDRQDADHRSTERTPQQRERPPNDELRPAAVQRNRWRVLWELRTPSRMSRW